MTPYVKIIKNDILWEGFLEHIPRKGEHVTVKNVVGWVDLVLWTMPQFIGGAVDPNNTLQVAVHIR